MMSARASASNSSVVLCAVTSLPDNDNDRIVRTFEWKSGFVFGVASPESTAIDSEEFYGGPSNETRWRLSVWPCSEGNLDVPCSTKQDYLTLALITNGHSQGTRKENRKLQVYCHVEILVSNQANSPTNICFLTDDRLIEEGKSLTLLSSEGARKYSRRYNQIAMYFRCTIFYKVWFHQSDIFTLIGRTDWETQVFSVDAETLKAETDCHEFSLMSKDGSVKTKWALWSFKRNKMHRHEYQHSRVPAAFLSLQCMGCKPDFPDEASIRYHINIKPRASSESAFRFRSFCTLGRGNLKPDLDNYMNLCRSGQYREFVGNRIPLRVTVSCTFHVYLKPCPKAINRRLPWDPLEYFNNSYLSDITFVVEGKEIPGHKIILSSQSKYFSTMFASNMRETTENKVEVTDVRYDIFLELLRYIYMKQTPILEEMTVELLEAADKYDVTELKAVCEEVACSKISVESAVSLMLCSILYNCPKLKCHAIAFIRGNKDDVCQTQEWKNLEKQNSQLLLELLKSFI